MFKVYKHLPLKPGRPKTTWRREFLEELREKNFSSFSGASTEAQFKDKWRTIVRGLRSRKKR